jgi:hypothetical protein
VNDHSFVEARRGIMPMTSNRILGYRALASGKEGNSLAPTSAPQGRGISEDWNQETDAVWGPAVMIMDHRSFPG